MFKEEKKFINKNKIYWNNLIIKNKNKKVVLIEGHLMGAPNYLLRTAIIAKAIERATGCESIVIINASKEAEIKAKMLYGSFGINKFINMKKLEIPSCMKIKAILRCVKIFIWNKPQEILQLSYNKLKLGHLVYDEILHDDIKRKSRNKHLTITNIDLFCLKHIYNFFIKLHLYNNLKIDKEIIAYVATHTVYCEYGILPFLMINRKTPVVYTDDFSIEIVKDFNGLFYHERIRRSIVNVISEYQRKDLIKLAEKNLKLRMKGNGNIDSKLAYSFNKKKYSREKLKNKLGINNKKPIVFIFAHIFRDSPHISTKMLYKDYYEWLVETLTYANKIKEINWVVKEHPSSEKIYNEKGVVLEILKKYKFSNILLCPADLNTNCINKVADAVVTCQGTIGIECSCEGIPVVVCGKAFYAGFGFTIEAHSKKQYKKILKDLKYVKKLDENQIRKAKMVYGAYQMCFGNHLSLLDNDILDHIWGYSGKIDIAEAYRLINERFENMDFVNSNLYQKVYTYFSNYSIKKDKEIR